MSFFSKFLSKKYLGVDIGTSYVRVVEINQSGKLKRLENYGEVDSFIFQEKSFRTYRKDNLLFFNKNISKAIKSIIAEAGIKTKQAVFSIPDFSTFFTSFNLPPMTKEELPEAVNYEARQHIPLPLKEVILDWQIIKSEYIGNKKTNYKILLVAVPKDIVNQYQEIANMSQLELVALEAEVFSLMRAISGVGEKPSLAIIDIGAKTTTCTIIDEGIIKASHSFDMSGNDLTAALGKKLTIDFKEAEKVRNYYGVKGTAKEAEVVKKIILPLIDIIVKEIKEVLDNFYKQEKKEVKKIVVAGGTALLAGLKEHLEESFASKKIEIANPFVNIVYPPALEETLLEIGPRFTIALGAALRGFQK